MTGPGTPEGRRSNGLLWVVAGGFAVLLAAWIACVVIACRHPVVPLSFATQGGAGR